LMSMLVLGRTHWTKLTLAERNTNLRSFSPNSSGRPIRTRSRSTGIKKFGFPRRHRNGWASTFPWRYSLTTASSLYCTN
jgi:hypothetical protein